MEASSSIFTFSHDNNWLTGKKNPSSCDGKGLILKPVSASIFELLQSFKKEFHDNHRLRNHIDENEKERILIYEYFKTNLLELVSNFPPLPLQARKTILKEVGLGLKDIHSKHWIHLGRYHQHLIAAMHSSLLISLSLDIKPDNILLNWRVDKEDRFHMEKVQLGDFDCALKLEGEKLLNHKIGNVMWQSPEGQLGRGIGKPSEVFSFGLTVSQLLN